MFLNYYKYSNKKIRDVLIKKGLSGTIYQIRAVRILLNETTTKTKIQEKLKVRKNTVFYMFERFESKGMLEYSPNLQDMRGQLVTLSKDFVRKYFGTPLMKGI